MIQDLLARGERAFFHSPLSFLRTYQKQVSEDFLSKLAAAERDGHVRRFGLRATLLVRRLEWDSNYFKIPFYRLEFAEWDESVTDAAGALAQSLKALTSELSDLHGRYYLFAEIPSEDLAMLQAMGYAGARLIETRLTYFRDDLQHFDRPIRSSVRLATEADIEALRKVAMDARNRFDRYHADPFFPQSVADEYLATFIENSVNGFADIVMVPAEGESLPGAFFTANLTPCSDSAVGLKLGRVVLVAVGEDRSGWHLRLMAEMTHHFKKCGVQVAYMATQSTNRAVIRNCEKLGYRLGRCTHVFATHA
jgi:dTDP-4-amino-4,6-dideoxy-D-galactose acyltransferase